MERHPAGLPISPPPCRVAFKLWVLSRRSGLQKQRKSAREMSRDEQTGKEKGERNGKLLSALAVRMGHAGPHQCVTSYAYHIIWFSAGRMGTAVLCPDGGATPWDTPYLQRQRNGGRVSRQAAHPDCRWIRYRRMVSSAWCAPFSAHHGMASSTSTRSRFNFFRRCGK